MNVGVCIIVYKSLLKFFLIHNKTLPQSFDKNTGPAEFLNSVFKKLKNSGAVWTSWVKEALLR